MIEHRPTSESKFLFNNKDLRDLSPEMPTKFNSDFYNRSSLPLNIRNQTQNQNPHYSMKPVSQTTIPRSWTDNSFFQNQIDCYLLKYSHLSRSERFIDLLELTKTQVWNSSTLNSIASIASLSSPLVPNESTNTRNLPKYDSKLTDSSSEESIVDNISCSPEKESTEPHSDVIFICDPEDSPLTIKLDDPNLQEEKSEEANLINNETSTETSDSVANTEFKQTDVFEISPQQDQKPSNQMLDNTHKKEEELCISNHESGGSNCSSLLSTTLNDSQGSVSGDASSSAKSTSPSDTTDLSRDNFQRNDHSTNNINNETLSRDMFENDTDMAEKNTSSPNDSSLSSGEEDDDDLLIRMPKKSCLKKFLQELNDEYSLIDSTADATSSPLGSPRSTNSSLLQWSSTTCEGGSSSQNQSLSSSSNSSIQRREKKRVSFADDSGKELFTVRTMSEPSNCPPKLTSKIVQYFLNREFNYGSQTDYSYNQSSYHSADYIANRLQRRDSFFSTSRSYDYGINASNYTNDVNQLKGSIAVYSLNFGQPAGDYFKFRQRLEENSVSLENVLLNGFQINGTIKVKNISFEKKVFLRCSFNKWQDYEDYEASYVQSEFYNSSNSLSSPSRSSYTAAFCGNAHYEPNHKEYDTFRFEFKLPKHAESEALSRPNGNVYRSNVTASIEFCICYQSGNGNNAKEFWDSNGGNNYEILQYVIDLERLKPLNHHPHGSMNKYQKNKKNYYGYESNKTGSSILGMGLPLEDEIYY